MRKWYRFKNASPKASWSPSSSLEGKAYNTRHYTGDMAGGHRVENRCVVSIVHRRAGPCRPGPGRYAPALFRWINFIWVSLRHPRLTPSSLALGMPDLPVLGFTFTEHHPAAAFDGGGSL